METAGGVLIKAKLPQLLENIDNINLHKLVYKLETVGRENPAWYDQPAGTIAWSSLGVCVIVVIIVVVVLIIRGRQLALDSREAVGVGQQRGSWRLDSRELAWNHGQGQSTPDSGDQWQTRWGPAKKTSRDDGIPVVLWNFR